MYEKDPNFWRNGPKHLIFHYDDVIMTTMAAQITGLTVVYSTVYSDANQRKHQSSASLAFVWGIHRDRWIPCTKGQLRGKYFHLMTSSCSLLQAHYGMLLVVESLDNGRKQYCYYRAAMHRESMILLNIYRSLYSTYLCKSYTDPISKRRIRG